MREKTIGLEIHFLPCVAYFSLIAQSAHTLILDEERYQKQSYRNRCRILGPNKIEEISLPVIGGSKALKPYIKDIEIDTHNLDLSKAWRSIKSAYGKAPFFEFYADGFEAVFNREHATLWQIDWALLTECLRVLRLKNKVSLASETKEIGDFVDLRDVIGPKGKQQIQWEFECPGYLQVFGSDFAQNLSVLDLLFCLGPDAGHYLSLCQFRMKTLKP